MMLLLLLLVCNFPEKGGGEERERDGGKEVTHSSSFRLVAGMGKGGRGGKGGKWSLSKVAVLKAKAAGWVVGRRGA